MDVIILKRWWSWARKLRKSWLVIKDIWRLSWVNKIYPKRWHPHSLQQVAGACCGSSLCGFPHNLCHLRDPSVIPWAWDELITWGLWCLQLFQSEILQRMVWEVSGWLSDSSVQEEVTQHSTCSVRVTEKEVFCKNPCAYWRLRSM